MPSPSLCIQLPAFDSYLGKHILPRSFCLIFDLVNQLLAVDWQLLTSHPNYILMQKLISYSLPFFMIYISIVLIFFSLQEQNQQQILRERSQMKQAYFARQPQGGGYGNAKEKEYTYFDSAVKRYMDKRRKNQTKKQQIQQSQKRSQISACTFRPILTSQSYYQTMKKNNHRQQKFSQQGQKQPTHVRLVNWNNRRQSNHRDNIIKKELKEIILRQSLSIDKSKQKRSNKINISNSKLNRSVQTFRSNSCEDDSQSNQKSHLYSQSNHHSYYQSFQSAKVRRR